MKFSGWWLATAIALGACAGQENTDNASRTRKRKHIYDAEIHREARTTDTAKVAFKARLDSLFGDSAAVVLTPVTESTLDSMGLDSSFYKKYANYNWYAATMLDPGVQLPFDPKDPDPAIDAFIEATEEPRPLNLDKVLASIVYPEAAKADGVAGKVQVKILINTDGYAKDFYVRRSPDIRLTHAVLEKCRFLHYRPAMLDSIPVKAWVNVSYTF